MLRVITGTAKGTKLEVPKTGTRPLTDRIKTSIFDLVRDFIPDANVLDLYAGSGSFGIEALSRGAKSATFVDLGSEAIDVIENNLFKTNFNEQGVIIQSHVNDFITSTNDKFDIIFLDPPFTIYKKQDLEAMEKILSDDGVLVYRIATKKDKKTTIEPLQLVFEKQYGKSIVKFLKKK